MNDLKGMITEIGIFFKRVVKDIKKRFSWMIEDIYCRTSIFSQEEGFQKVKLTFRCALCGEVIERPSSEVRIEINSSTSTMSGNLHKDTCSWWVRRWLEQSNHLFYQFSETKHPRISIPEYTWIKVKNAWEEELEFEKDNKDGNV